jgi:hypothetical protein
MSATIYALGSRFKTNHTFDQVYEWLTVESQWIVFTDKKGTQKMIRTSLITTVVDE